MPDNREFCESMVAALTSLGPEEALSCMARMMCAIASNHGGEMDFTCDLGVVTIVPTPIKQQS